MEGAPVKIVGKARLEVFRDGEVVYDTDWMALLDGFNRVRINQSWVLKEDDILHFVQADPDGVVTHESYMGRCL